MIQNFICFLMLAICPFTASSQSSNLFIEGKILENSTGDPIPYAKIYNQTTQSGVLSSENGYFRLAIQAYSDVVNIKVVGFEPQQVVLNENTHFYQIKLEESVQLLGEVTVRPEDASPLYKLMQDCKKNQSGRRQMAKMYYELKSYVDNRQVELVENFYNGEIYGYDLERLNLKTGRFALQDFDNTFFGSMESSKAITMLKLFKKNDYFPQSPFELAEKKLKELYYLRLHSKYRDERLDSIYVLDFIPKDKSGRFFTGRVWINQGAKTIVQTELNCPDAQIYPFNALFPTDTIQKLDLSITKSFQEVNGKMCFQHIDFSYRMTYKNRRNRVYETSTQAILYAYDYDSLFFQPVFKFGDISDYKKINALPYNRFFWKNHAELKVSDQKNENDAFFTDQQSTTNLTAFSPGKFGRGLYEHPYITWSGNRIRFREFSDTTQPLRMASVPASMYNLSVSLFLDLHPFKDTMQVVTSAIFNPYESFYRLPLDQAALYFINVYFDLAEMERRELEKAIQRSDRKIATIEKLHQESVLRLEATQTRYLREVEHGNNQRAMEKWNSAVYAQLRIDNYALYRPY